jgi:DNA primase
VAGFTGLWSRSSGWRNQAHTSYSSWLRVVALSPDADGTTDQDDFSLLRNATNNKAPVRSNEIGNGRIDFNQLSEMKESIDIISVIESYDLDRFERKSDDRATALCPFHDDENPSLSIDRTRKMYKCFSCGAGGDAFRFVREYSKLKGQQMSFYEAVLEVSTKFGDGHVEGIGKSVQAESPELRQRKERTLYANAVAAAFYATCLTKPSAGGARQYLRQRGLTPEAVRTFALGFAPDFYYGANRSRKKWGEDSLVQHMQSLNFTVDELLEAGLATETKTTEEPVQKFSFGEDPLLEGAFTSKPTSTSCPFDSIIDRFRFRIVVPIMDKAGANVLGFGGRILPSIVEMPNAYNPPKYLNSPESLVFKKKCILFGHSLAKETVKQPKKSEHEQLANTLILVEGYMDVMSLWTIGVRNVVAAMGTAVTMDQLAIAAKSIRNGNLVLCLDNDSAGLLALERLCSNGLLSRIVSKYGTEISIALLPSGIKDPGEFIESKAEAASTTIADAFQTEVLSKSQDWIDWYLQQLLESYDSKAGRGRAGSFGDVFERVANFLANNMGPADRTKHACEIAVSLAKTTANEMGSDHASSAVQNQLESDLIDLSSRLAEKKRAIQRRTELVNSDGNVGSQKDALFALTRGSGPSADESDKLSSSASKGSDLLSVALNDVDLLDKFPAPSFERASLTRRKRTHDAAISRTLNKALTPHFSGFRFMYKSDSQWLGVDEDKLKGGELTLGYIKNTWRKKEKSIYFNSNDYHGHQFLTEDAMDAGYVNRNVRRDPSFVEKGVACLVYRDTELMLKTAEDNMLTTLVDCPSARTVLKNMLDARSATGSSNLVEWTNTEKEWLFSTLVYSSSSIPEGCTNRTELMRFLKRIPDCPPQAFIHTTVSANRNSNSKKDFTKSLPESSNEVIGGKEIYGRFDTYSKVGNGTLSLFFNGVRNDLDSAASLNVTRVNVLTQERWAAVLWASTAHQARQIREELLSLSNAMEGRTATGIKNVRFAVSPEVTLSSDHPVEGDGNPCDSTRLRDLTIALQNKNRVLQTLSDSSKRLWTKLVDETLSDGIEGHVSASLQMDLSVRLDEYLNAFIDVPSQKVETTQKLETILSGLEDEEPYEDTLERIAKDWGEWADDDYLWTMDDAISKTNKKQVASPDLISAITEDEDDENVEDALQRISRDWAEWDE